LDISVFFLDNTEGVDVGLLDLDDSISTKALFEAVSVILFSALLKAINIATEFFSNFNSSDLVIGSHSFYSGIVCFLSNQEFSISLFQKSNISILEVAFISVVFLDKSIFLGLWKFAESGGAFGFGFNTSSHLFMVLPIIITGKDIRVNALCGNSLVAITADGKFIEESDLILSDWFQVLSEDDVLSNFV